MKFYSNLPTQKTALSSSDKTTKAFNNYRVPPTNIDGQTYDAIIGFFESRGFLDSAAETMAYAIINQSIKDNINPFTLIDTLSGVKDVELSRIVTQVLNSSRYKTSMLGTGSKYRPSTEVARNLLA